MSKQIKQSLESAGMEEDSSYYVARYGVQGLQWGCLAATPLYFLQTLRGRGFSLRNLVRYNWLVPVSGASIGSVAGYMQAASSDHTALGAKVNSLRLDANRVRQDDLHLIGSVIGALVLPAIFLKRVGLVNGLLGGAGLGGATGLIMHQIQKSTTAATSNPSKPIESIKQDANTLAQNTEKDAKTLANKAENKVEDLANKAQDKFQQAKQEVKSRM